MNRLIVSVTVAGLMLSCKNAPNGPADVENGRIVIKGTIAASAQSTKMRKLADSPSRLSDATKVLVFSKHYYSLSDIVDHTFSVTGQIGTGVALIFLDANNKYIGNLSSHGLDMLPLGNLVNGENTVIDLATLTFVGSSVIPSHDPFGNEIQMSETEIQSLKIIDGYYESIAKNIDADNDGVPDVLSNSQLVIDTRFMVYGGHWGCNDSTPRRPDEAQYFVNYMLEVGGGSSLTFSNENITMSGPAEDPYSDIIRWGCIMAPACGADRGFFAVFGRMGTPPTGAPWGTALLPFRKGTYALTLEGNRSFTVVYSNIDVQYNLVILIPTLHTNSDGKLTSISFDYRLHDGTVVNPASMLTNVMVQLSDSSAHQFYVNDSNKLTGKTGFTVLTVNPPVDISSLVNIDAWYDDLLGNSYDIVWR
jgi:hypothetical protein